MSYGQNPFQESPKVYGADFQTAPHDFQPEKSRGGCGRVVVFSCALLLVGCLGIVGYLLVQQQNREKAVRDRLAVESLKLDGKPARLRMAFNSPSSNIAPKEEAAIRAAIGQIMKIDSADVAGLLEHVDASAFMDQMLRSAELDRLPAADRRFIRQNFDEATDGPNTFDEYRCVTFEKLNEAEVLVYLHAWDDDNYERARNLRWWMIRSGDTWELSDWEDLRNGLSGASEYAIINQYYDSPLMDGVYNAYDELGKVVEAMEEDDWDVANELLTNVQDIHVHPKLHDNVKLSIAYHWTYVNGLDEAAPLFEKINNHDTTPGAVYGLASVAFENDDHEETIELATQYQSLVGRNPCAMLWQARSHEALGNKARAIERFEQALSINPDHIESLRSVARLVSPDNTDKIRKLVEASSDPTETALSLTTYIYSKKQAHLLRVAAEVIKKHDAKPGAAEFIAGRLHELDYDYPAAAASFLKALQASTATEDRSSYREAYLTTICDIGTPLEAYHQLDEKQDVFEELCGLYEDGDYEVTAAQILELTALHEKQFPDDPWVHYYRGSAQVELDQLEAAEETYRAGWEKWQDNEEVSDSYEYSLIDILVQRDKEHDAYEFAAKKENAFGRVARSWLEKDQLDDLEKLLAVHEAAVPDDPMLPMYRAQLAAAQGDLAGAIGFLAGAVAPEDKPYLRNTFDDRLANLHVKNKSWATWFAGHEEKSRLFETLAEALREQDVDLDASRDLEQLWRLHEDAGLDRIDRVALDITWAGQDSNDEQVVTRYETLSDAEKEALQESEHAGITNTVTEAYLRTGQFDQAAVLAEADDNTRYLALIALQRADLAELDVLLGELEGSFWFDRIYYGEFAKSLREDDQFAELRKKHPPGLRDKTGIHTTCALSESSPSLSDASLRAAIEPICGGPVVIEKLATDLIAPNAGGWIARSPGATLLVCLKGELAISEATDAPLRAVLSKHKHCIEVTVLLPLQRPQASVLSTRVAAALGGEQALALWSPTEYDAVLAPQGQLADLQTDAPKWWNRHGKYAYLYDHPTAGEEANAMTPFWQTMQATLRGQAEFRNTPEAACYVVVRRECGSVTESVKLRVIELDGETVTAEFIEASPLEPLRDVGDRINIPAHEIDQWQTESTTGQS